MQVLLQVSLLSMPVKKWLGIISLSCMMMACTKVDVEQNTENKDVVKNKQEAITVAKAIQVDVQIEPLTPKLTGCEGKLCPDIKIYRLNSNFTELDTSVDRYIYSYMLAFLQGFDLPENTNDVQPVQPNQVNNPVEGIQKNKMQSEVTVSDNETITMQSAKASLIEQIQPHIDKFVALSNEVKSLGSSAQLSLYIKPQVLNPKGPVSTVVINSNNYIGGAHGSSAQQYINFELETKKILNLEQIIKANKRQDLNNVVHQKFQEWVKDTQPDMDLKLYEELWRFRLSTNFYLSPQGLILQYGEYEIGPYAVGAPRLIVPYAELKQILKPQYLPKVNEEKITQIEKQTG